MLGFRSFLCVDRDVSEKCVPKKWENLLLIFLGKRGMGLGCGEEKILINI
jgi:hypothetical protein